MMLFPALHADCCWLLCVFKGMVLTITKVKTHSVHVKGCCKLKSAYELFEINKAQLGWNATTYLACLKTSACFHLSWEEMNTYQMVSIGRMGSSFTIIFLFFHLKYFPTDNFSANDIYMCSEYLVIQRGLFRKWNLITDTSQTTLTDL